MSNGAEEEKDAERVLLTTCMDNAEAALLQGRLGANGIHTTIQGEQHRSMLGVMGSYIELRVYVARRDEEAARALLEPVSDAGTDAEVDESPAEAAAPSPYAQRRRVIGWSILLVLFILPAIGLLLLNLMHFFASSR